MATKSGDINNMTPKNSYDPTGNSRNNVEEADLQEISAVNESLDELSNALDFFEQRTDNIIEQLQQLLHSNREIRQQLAMEKAELKDFDMEEP
ncbi:UPF0184 protein CG14818 [Glossina fuscipes fuscipes]